MVRGSRRNGESARAIGYRDRVLWLVAGALVILVNCAWPSCGATTGTTTHPAPSCGTATTHQAQSSPTSSPQAAGSILVGANVDVSQAPGSQDEVSAAVDPADPSILLAGSNSLQFDPSVRVYGSGDAGRTWGSALLPLPSTATSTGAVDQWVAIGPDHRQAMSYIASGGTPQAESFSGLALFVATRSAPSAAWQAPSAPVDGIPTQGGYDDKDTLAADNSATSPFRGRLYVAWTRWISGDESGPGEILVSHSADWGRTWSRPVVVQQQYANWGAALALAPDGDVMVAWAGLENLWIACSADGGDHFSAPLGVDTCRGPLFPCIAGAAIPAQTDAGVRANPSLAVIPASNGQPAQVAVVFTNGDGAHARIELARFDASTLHPLGSPTLVPLGTPGTDQFLPAAAYDPGAHLLWVCAYTSLLQAQDEAQYTCTASLDGGNSFLSPVTVASVPSNEEQPGAYRNFIGRQYGDYTDVVAADGVAHAFWTDSRKLTSLSEEIFTATLRLSSAASGSG